MYCEHPITYAVKSGDNLFLLSRRFKTTVQMILFLNPGINPYNLQIGQSLIICPGEDYLPEVAPELPIAPVPPCENEICPFDQNIPQGSQSSQNTSQNGQLNQNQNISLQNQQSNQGINNSQGMQMGVPVTRSQPQTDCQKRINFINEMRLMWSQHAYWTRMAIISITGNLKDKTDTVGRLMQNAYDVAKIFAEYYPLERASEIEKLISEHLDLGGRLVTALTDGQMQEANDLNRRWYQNAEQLASAFARLTPFYNEERLKDTLFSHLEMITRMTAYRLGEAYQEDIREFGEIERDILKLADYLSNGIMQEFPSRF